MTTAALAAAMGLVLLWWGWRATWWWEERALGDPERDPAARRITVVHRNKLAEAIARGSVEDGLEATRVGFLHWRGGLRQIVDMLDELPMDDDGNALRAEVRLALGEVGWARRLVESIPVNHWRACVVRAGLYAVDGDPDRADSALVAALQLAPPAARDGVLDRLTALRARFPRRRSPHLGLWERPP